MIKEEIKKLKEIVKNSTSCEEIKNYILENYEQISDRKDKPEYSEQYSLVDIANGKYLKTLRRKFKGETEVTVIVEIISYSKVPRGYIVAYNKVDSNYKCEIAICM